MAAPKVDRKCYRHADCAADSFCSVSNRCAPALRCSHASDASDATTPIDGLCPMGPPEATSNFSQAVSKNKAAPMAAAALDPEAPAATVQLRVYAGHFVDQVRFVLSNGTVTKFGEDGGQLQPVFTVPEGEWITWIKVYQGSNLDGIQFYTNRGSSSEQFGGSGGKKHVFHVDKGSEVFGLDFAPGSGSAAFAPPIVGIQQRPRVRAPAAVSHGGMPYVLRAVS